MSTDTPMTDAIELLDRPARHKALWDKCAEFERENARLREDEKGLLQDIARLTEEAFKRDEELAEAKRAAIDYMEKWHKAIHQRDAAQVTANLLQHAQAAIDAERKRAEQAEARALEYKTEHAALLGTSQWQEVEIADLRDDVKRLMQTVSECEERALANEKDAGRLRWLLEDHEHPATRELRNSLLNRMQVMSYSAACTDIDAAIAGAKHD